MRRDPAEAVAELGRRRVDALAAADRLRGAVLEARAAGVSWDVIARELEVRYRPAGSSMALGELFPNGTSRTTVRRTYDRGSR